MLNGQTSVNDGFVYDYTYDVRQNTFNGRTLKRFSGEAADLMKYCPTCGFYPDYEKFVKYYGDYNYGDKWITAALERSQTNFLNGRGDADFSTFNNKGAEAQAIQKGTAYMNVLMYVIREMEDAIGDCRNQCAIGDCNDADVHALDEAVAFYAGSLEKSDGSGDGVLLYNLADKRALDFRTAGESGTDEAGTAYINIEIIREFQRAQLFLLEKDCDSAEVNKDIIINYLKVPLVQGALRYAYIRAFQNPENDGAAQKAEAEGAVFAASVLPWVDACSEKDADLIYENLRVGSAADEINFAKVKKAFESNYKCMGISGAQVGGLWTVNGYAKGFSPAGTGSGSNAGVVVGSIIGGVLGLGLLILLWLRCGSKKSAEKSGGNIAAVSEIS